MNNSQSIYFQNLDGLRFFAFLTVFISHAALFLGYENNSGFYQWFKEYVLVNGDIGVSFFFVLSGFLITYLLLREQDIHGKISLKKFYMRRILRIWPVYFLTLGIGFLVLPHMFPHVPLPFNRLPSAGALPWYLTFLANFSLAFHGGASVPLDVLWSISVEEQFYLVWPWVVAFIPRKFLGWFLGSVIMASSAYRYMHAAQLDVLAYSTFSVMSYLAIGGLLALLVHLRSSVVMHMRSIVRSYTGPLYLLMMLLIIGRHYLSKFSYSSIAYLSSVVLVPIVLGLLFAFVIDEQNYSDMSFFKAGQSKLFTFFGKISYGFYAYHMIAFSIVLLAASRYVSIARATTSEWVLYITFSFVVCLGLAAGSYRLIETWFLKKKPA